MTGRWRAACATLRRVLADGPTVRTALLDVDGIKGPFG